MAQSLAAVYVHLVFSTKTRQPFLQDKEIRDRVHAYLGGVSKGLKCPALLVGGVEYHVHILARQDKTVCLSDWVRDLKSNSTGWIKTEFTDLKAFAWQGGYGAFSVDIRGLDEVQTYIRNQEEHHRKVTFQEEFLELLRLHGIEWDARYIWD